VATTTEVLEQRMTSSNPTDLPPPPIPPEPSWGAPHSRGPGYGSLLVGLVILGIGIWYFADRTLGLELPRLDADQLWPVAVIAVGLWLIVRPRR
jgi:hypothetical protein